MKVVTILSRLSIFSVILLYSSVKCDTYGSGIPTDGPTEPTPISPTPPSTTPSPPTSTTPPSPPSSTPSPPTSTTPPSPPSSPPSSTPSPPTSTMQPSPPSSTTPPPTNDSTSSTPTGNYTNDITGQWYVVMANNCGDKGVWKMACNCLTVYFRPLEPDNWQMYLSSIKKESSCLVVSMGGVQALSSGDTEFKGFILSGAEVPMSVLCTDSSYTISEAVHGCSAYSQFEMSIIGYSAENFYMITTVKYEETDYTLVWSRKRAPGKKTIWTKIVENLNSLSINPHDLEFVQQLDCKIPTLNQYDEMFFCL